MSSTLEHSAEQDPLCYLNKYSRQIPRQNDKEHSKTQAFRLLEQHRRYKDDKITFRPKSLVVVKEEKPAQTRVILSTSKSQEVLMRKQNIQFQHQKQNFMKMSVAKEKPPVSNMQKYTKKMKERRINQQSMKALLSSCLGPSEEKNRRYNTPVLKLASQIPVLRPPKVSQAVEKSIVHQP